MEEVGQLPQLRTLLPRPKAGLTSVRPTALATCQRKERKKERRREEGRREERKKGVGGGREGGRRTRKRERKERGRRGKGESLWDLNNQLIVEMILSPRIW